MYMWSTVIYKMYKMYRIYNICSIQDLQDLQDVHDLQDLQDVHDLQDLQDVHDLQCSTVVNNGISTSEESISKYMHELRTGCGLDLTSVCTRCTLCVRM